MIELLFICGSLRKESSSRALGMALADRLAQQAKASFARIDDLPHFNADIEGDAAVARLKSEIEGAAGLVFVTPEYNYSVPGVLKNAIDWASRPAMKSVFRRKPAFVITVSGGALGGVRAQSHLKYILNGMLADVYSGPEVVVPQANKSVEQTKFVNEQVLDFATMQLSDFIVSL